MAAREDDAAPGVARARRTCRRRRRRREPFRPALPRARAGGLPRLCVHRTGRGPRARARLPARLHAGHAEAGRGTVLHAANAPAGKPQGARLEGRTARLRRTRPHSGLPPGGGRRRRRLAQRRARPIRQHGVPLPRPPVHRPGRGVPLRNHPADPLPRTHRPHPRQGSGGNDARPHHPDLFPGPRAGQRTRLHLPRRPRDAARSRRGPGVARAFRLRARPRPTPPVVSTAGG